MSASVAHRHGGPSGSRHHGPSGGHAPVQRKRTGSSHSREDARMIGQWRIGRTIGKGSSGRVKIAKHAITGKYAAIKIVPKGLILTSRMSMSEAGAKADKVLLGIEREIVIMKLIDHPNVLSLYDVWETSTELYLIMEYVPGGELFDYLVKRGRLPPSEALHYFQQIIFAVDYCHRFNICHRDLKPENLLLDKDKNIKVADFGMAAWEAGEKMLETSCGSPHYASPEIVAGKAYHGSASDIWSCGIILFALLTGRLPFDDDNIRSLLQKVKIGLFEMPDEIKDPARDLLRRMLEKDPERRITMPEILRHPFFVSRAPRPIPGRSLVDPPSLDEVERPVNNPAEIDADIMGNLKTLWSGASDDEIIAALMSREKTWEKTIYHLLITYRSKHLENYNMDDDELPAKPTRSHPSSTPRKSPGGPQPQSSGITSPRSPPAGRSPLGQNETIQERLPVSPPTRPSAPTPKKAAAGGAPTQKTQTPAVGAAGGGITSPTRGPSKLSAPPRGPRAPNSPAGGIKRELTPTDENAPPTPSIVLHQPTPTKEMLPPPSPMLPSTPQLPNTPSLPPAPMPSPLNVPTVQDEQLQHFFNEVASQLNTMNIRSSVASTSSSTSPALQQDYQAYLAYAAGVPLPGPSSSSVRSASPSVATSPASPTGPLVGGGGGGGVDPSQFADADGDDSELASEYSHAHSAMSAQPPLVGLGFGPPPGVGLQATGPGQNPNRWSYASSGGSRFVEADQANRRPQGPQHPLKSFRPAPAPPPMPTRAAPRPPIIATRTEGSQLPRDTSYVVVDTGDVPPSMASKDSSWASRQSGFSQHRGQDGFGMLKKKKKALSVEPVEYSPEFGSSTLGATPVPFPFSPSPSSTMGTPSPKRSWFNNLFSFKPPSCTLLSHDNVANTRDKSKKILVDLGVRLAVVEIDGIRALKCRLDEIKDAQGAMTVVKGVRFRVEFSRSTPNPRGGYNTLVSLTQEKGAHSSLRLVFSQLRNAIEASESQPPSSTASTATGNGGNTTPGLMPRPSVHHAKSYHTSPPQGRGAGSAPLSAPPMRYANSEPNTPVFPQEGFAASPVIGGGVSPGQVLLPSAIRM